MKKMSPVIKGKDIKIYGFTLIELLIVIAIILILISIALPNFLEAQIRARVTRAKSELRSLHVAMDSYYLDFKIYPPESERNTDSWNHRGFFWLTTPIAYIRHIPQDPFTAFGADESEGRTYITFESGGLEPGTGICPMCMVTWMMFSNGPDAVQEINGDNPTYYGGSIVMNYSPTNGTTSSGSIYRWGGDSFWVGMNVPFANAINRKPRAYIGLWVDSERYVHRLPHF
jgi:prepilin-type N-terminal cleavage/methylation domain-containing protein